MFLSLALATSVAFPPAFRCEEVPARAASAPFLADSALLALYASGESFDAFLARAEVRRAMWVRNWEASRVSDDVLARARAIPGRWRLLVAAVDGCSDSVNTVPYLARLVALVPSIELRIVTPADGRVFMERHRTPDGRAATPTLVILDEGGRDVGCWVERPKALQDLAIKARADGTTAAFLSGKQAWYDSDAGASTVREVVDAIAAAASGAPRC